MPLQKQNHSLYCKHTYLLLLSSFSIFAWVVVYNRMQLSYKEFSYPEYTMSQDNNNDYYEGADGYLIKQIGCHIPKMFLTGPLVDKYITKDFDDKPICEIRNALIKDDLSSLKINYYSSALESYNITNIKEQLKCVYTPFHRKDKKSNTNLLYSDNLNEFSNNSVKFERRVMIQDNDEFVRVICNNSDNSKVIYEDYFAFVPLKENVEKRCEEMKKQNVNKKIKGNHRKINVLMIGIDALSRLNFHRQLNKSSKFYRKSLNALEMYGYNKVGDNTFPNLIPVLTGKAVEEIKLSCWKDGTTVFDNCSFVWDSYKQMGFRTAFAEDCSKIGLFNYLKKGFNKQPTDYYYRPFDLQADIRIGNSKPGNCNLCMGSRMNFHVLMNYALKYAQTMLNKDYFGLFWSTSLTHDYFNFPRYADETFFNFSFELSRKKLLHNTILVLISDHGLRWGAYRETYQGHLEERLPLLMFVLPKWFQKWYPKAFNNMRTNMYRLTTPFDLHETLNDLSDLSSITDSEIQKRSQRIKELERSASPRGISLFLTANSDRSCSTAGIPPHYCTCHDTVSHLNNKSSLAVNVGKALVTYINSLIENYPKCSKLHLKNVLNIISEQSNMGSSRDNITESWGSTYYMITIRTSPSDGLFEATLRHDQVYDKYTAVGSVSRLNMYGKQSTCVSDYELRLYCYCF